MRDCAAVQWGGAGRTGCESQGGWDLSGMALVTGEIFPHGRSSWSLGAELGAIVEPNPGTWLVASGFIRIWL